MALPVNQQRNRKNPHIGKMRERIDIMARAEAPDTSGLNYKTTETFTKVGEGYAAVVPLSAITRLDLKQIADGASHKFYLRYRPDLTITSRHWIEWKGRRFNIVGKIYINEEQRFIEFMASEQETIA